jgi:hypothetical protein
MNGGISGRKRASAVQEMGYTGRKDMIWKGFVI